MDRCNNRLKIKLDKEKFFLKMLILCEHTDLFLQPKKDILPIKHPNNCMSRYRKILQKVFASLLFIALVSFNNTSFAADGEALFKANCASCHKPLEDYTGPKLQGAREREPSPEWACHDGAALSGL